MRLSLAALLLGAAISLPLGVFVSSRERVAGPVLAAAGVIQTIPSLALLAFMVPLLSMIGFWPALIALTLYSILPMLRNTVTGIQNVDAALSEAARGVGMTDGQRLLRVEIPQALPVIMAGIRTATVWVVGMATISTPIGAPSLGNYIFTGLQTRNYDAVMVGCVAAAVLALLLDNAVRLMELGFARRNRTLTGVGAVLLGCVSLLGLLGLGGNNDDRVAVRIGGKPYTEQYILTRIIARTLPADRYQTEVVGSLGTTVVFDALTSGEIQTYVDFSGTLWATVMKRTGEPADPDKIVEIVTKYLADEHDVVVVGELGFENRYAFAMRGKQADELGVKTVSQLVEHGPHLSIASDFEFFGRTEWKSVREKYGLDFGTKRSMGSQLMYAACAEGEVDVITAYTTDGRIDALDLRVLEDDRHAIPPYHALILVNGAFARAQPDAMAALKTLVGTIDETAMRRMNRAVDADGRAPRVVAEEFLK